MSQVPQIKDFSQESIKKAVNKQIVSNPVTWYGLSFGGFLIASKYILFPLAIWLLWLGIVFASISSLYFVISAVLLRRVLANRHIANLNKLVAQHKEKILKSIVKELSEYLNDIELNNYADQGIEQFNRIQSKYKKFKTILQDKYDTRELSYKRFLGSAEQLSFAGLDNLKRISNSLQIISNIDMNYISKRMKYLNDKNFLEQADIDEKETLQNRESLRFEELKKVNVLLTENEKSMTALDESMIALNNVPNKTERSEIDTETAQRELDELISKFT